jgi:hypothetical protein
MEELGRRFAAAAPDVAVLVTPHSVHVDGHFAVVTAGRGEWETDAGTAAALVEAPLPILGVSYDGNDLTTAEFPLVRRPAPRDHGLGDLPWDARGGDSDGGVDPPVARHAF